MAIAEQEITRQLSIPLNQAQQERLERAALATGQSLESFAASALLRAADEALNRSRPAVLPAGGDPLDRIAGIFKDEPLMDALMERVREDQRLEMEAETKREAGMEAGASS